MPILGRRARKDVVRLYVVSDFHASAPAWRKMLNAIRMNVYKADAVLYAGDLTGKAIVPVVRDGDHWEADLLGQKRRPRNEQQLQDLDRDIAALGYYPYHTSRAEVDALHGDAAALDQLFAREIRAQVSEALRQGLLALEPLERRAVYFNVLCDCDWALTAQYLGCSISTAKKHLKRGLEKLEECRYEK